MKNQNCQSKNNFLHQIGSLTEHKKYHTELCNIIDFVVDPNAQPHKNQNIKMCGNNIGIHINTGRIATADFCKWRYCPMCAWRKSLRKYGENIQIAEKINNANNQFIFLTLTMRNCEMGKLSGSIDFLNAAWARLIRRQRFKKVSNGYIKTLEISFNQTEQTWHPHIHIIICVDNEYFHKNYISAHEWRQMWQQVTGDNRITQIDIQAVKNDNIPNAIAEISKYTAKIKSITDISNTDLKIAALRELDVATNNRRLNTVTGIFRETATTLGIDVDDDDTVNGSDNDTSDVIQLIWDKQAKTYRKKD